MMNDAEEEPQESGADAMGTIPQDRNSNRAQPQINKVSASGDVPREAPLAVRLDRARAALVGGNPVLALHELNQESALLHPSLAELEIRGAALCALGDLEAGITTLNQAVEEYSSHAPAHLNLAEALHRSGRTEAAIAHATAALQLSPDYARARQALELWSSQPPAGPGRSAESGTSEIHNPSGHEPTPESPSAPASPAIALPAASTGSATAATPAPSIDRLADDEPPQLPWLAELGRFSWALLLRPAATMEILWPSFIASLRGSALLATLFITASLFWSAAQTFDPGGPGGSALGEALGLVIGAGACLLLIGFLAAVPALAIARRTSLPFRPLQIEMQKQFAAVWAVGNIPILMVGAVFMGLHIAGAPVFIALGALWTFYACLVLLSSQHSHHALLLLASLVVGELLGYAVAVGLLELALTA